MDTRARQAQLQQEETSSSSSASSSSGVPDSPNSSSSSDSGKEESSSREPLASHIQIQLIDAILANGGLKKFGAGKKSFATEIYDEEEDSYGAAGSDLRLKCRYKVQAWKRKDADLLVERGKLFKKEQQARLPASPIASLPTPKTPKSQSTESATKVKVPPIPKKTQSSKSQSEEPPRSEKKKKKMSSRSKNYKEGKQTQPVICTHPCPLLICHSSPSLQSTTLTSLLAKSTAGKCLFLAFRR
jgi:hypothetical protein